MLFHKKSFFKINVLELTLVIFCLVMLSTSYSEAKVTHSYGKYRELAIKYQKEKNYRQAEQVFNVGISKYPRAAMLYFWRAKLRGNYMGKTSKAISDYSIVLRLNERKYYPKSYYMRGNAYYKLGCYQNALHDLNNCLRVNPKYNDRVYIDRAKANAKLGLVSDAKKDIDFLIKRKSKFANAAMALWTKILTGKSDF